MAALCVRPGSLVGSSGGVSSHLSCSLPVEFTSDEVPTCSAALHSWAAPVQGILVRPRPQAAGSRMWGSGCSRGENVLEGNLKRD